MRSTSACLCLSYVQPFTFFMATPGPLVFAFDLEPEELSVRLGICEAATSTQTPGQKRRVRNGYAAAHKRQHASPHTSERGRAATMSSRASRRRASRTLTSDRHANSSHATSSQTTNRRVQRRVKLEYAQPLEAKPWILEGATPWDGQTGAPFVPNPF